MIFNIRGGGEYDFHKVHMKLVTNLGMLYVSVNARLRWRSRFVLVWVSFVLCLFIYHYNFSAVDTTLLLRGGWT